MSTFLITCPDDPRWELRLEGCDREHAESVLRSLEEDPTARQNLELHELKEGLLHRLLGRS